MNVVRAASAKAFRVVAIANSTDHLSPTNILLNPFVRRIVFGKRLGIHMKSLILLVIVGAGASFGFPLINEDAGSECDALERLVVRVALSTDNRKPQPHDALLGQFFQGFSKGQFASVAVSNEYPNVPVTVACALLYWRAIVDPKGFKEDAAKFGS
jgi:hypothetical protein